MNKQIAVKTREKWVDDIKVIACILVVLGHFFQSMTKASIMPENDLYKWFKTQRFTTSTCRYSSFVADTFIRSTAR